MTLQQKNISCKKATVLMSKSIENPLTIKEKAELAAHLAICKTCCFCLTQIKAVRKTLTKYTEALFKHPPEKSCMLSQEAKKHIKEKLSYKIK